MEEITHMDGALGAGHVYSVELTRLMNMMEVAEGKLLLDRGEAIKHVLDAIDYGSDFAAPTSTPRKNCLRLLGRTGYDQEKDVVLFTAPLLSCLLAAGLKPAGDPDVPAGNVLVIELLRMEKGLHTVRPSESMTRTMWPRLAMSIPTINMANTILLKFADSPRDLMSHILLRDERRVPHPVQQ